MIVSAAVKVLVVGSELAPLAKTGGLADVMAALPRQLVRRGHDVRVIIPFYARIDASKLSLQVVVSDFDLRLGSHGYRARLLEAANPGGPRLYLLDCPALYSRGGLYTQDADEHRRFLALCYCALGLCQRLDWSPEIIHANDWQAALLPMIIQAHYRRDPRLARTRTLLTIHNLMYQGTFGAHTLADTNLGGVAHMFHQDQLREGRINYLLHGILYADAVTTVSPTYAREIQRPELGAGLDPFLRARSSTVLGILNGVDYGEWSPGRDPHLAASYGPDDLAGKELDKRALLEGLGLPYVKGIPVIGIVSRLAAQKGLLLTLEVMTDLLRRHGFQLVVLGSGEPRFEEGFSRLQAQFPRQVCFYRGFSETLAHRIEAGADMFLMPSLYEPCGLNQMYSLRYGTVPIVHRTGGLADTVEPWEPRHGEGTGFAFERHDQAGLRWAIEQALVTYKNPRAWHRLQRNGMAKDFSWDTQAAIYEKVYDTLRQAT
jgi:starch synthase